MKNHLQKLIFFFSILIIFTGNVFSQTCLPDLTDVNMSWNNIPRFDGSSSHIEIDKTSGGYADWFDGSFTMNIWVYCYWDAETIETEYAIFSLGKHKYVAPEMPHYNCIYFGFENVGGTWKLCVGDKTPKYYLTSAYEGGWTHSNNNTDKYYTIDYDEYQNTWVNLTLVYDDSNHDISIYKDGAAVVTDHPFIFQQDNIQKCYIGHYYDDDANDFYGTMSGLRIWEGKLDNDETTYIYDKTFDGVETFNDTYSYLNANLKLNMHTNSTDGISSLGGDALATFLETDITWKTDVYHPAKPVNIYGAIVTENFDNIRLDWETTGYGTTYVYRRLNGSGDYTLVCRTNNNYFIDDYNNFDNDNDVNTFDDGPFDYKLVPVWKDHPTNTVNVEIEGEETVFTDVDFKRFDDITLQVASDNTCDGKIVLSWNSITNPTPSTYSLQYQVGTDPWSSLMNSSNTSYTHTLNETNYDKVIHYRVDACCDGFWRFSNEVEATTNKICTATPNIISAVLLDESIIINWNLVQTGGLATEFKLYRNINGGAYELLNDDIDITSTSFSDDIIASCTHYKYKVEAYNSCCGSTGPMSSESADVIRPMSFSNVFTYTESSVEKAFFDASKGYFSTKVLLEWIANPNKISDVNSYEIYRKIPSGSFSLLTTIDNANATYFEDNTAEANVFYEYKIRALGACGIDDYISDSLLTTGFRSSSGIVAGKVSYAGGNAVEGVEVRVSNPEDIGASSLYFDGNDYVYSTDFAEDSIYHNPFCIEAWFKPTNLTTYGRMILSINNGSVRLYIYNKKLKLSIRENLAGDPLSENYAFMTVPEEIISDQWYHAAANFDPISQILELYVNGNLVLREDPTNLETSPWVTPEWTSSVYQDFVFTIGAEMPYDGSTNNYPFTGNIDEVRIWQKFRDSAEIKRDYTRTLSGSEEGLIGYYRMDENYGSGTYDLSCSNLEYNKNNFYFDETIPSSHPTWSMETPSYEQLHPAGVTDASGDYSVQGIKYIGSGNIVSVTPFLGVHEFSPNNTNLFIGDASPVHNNVNFIDQSSFTFTATVYFSGTNFPVEGVNIYIDNIQQFDGGGIPIQTTQSGQISISVPIGQHYISLKKDGHEFEFNGQYPIPTENDPYKTFYFQDDVPGITFYDKTTVVLCGRFVGGDIEGDKKNGFEKSIANIGQGIIVFKNELGYDIDTDTLNSTNRIEVMTDSESGEYEVTLLPAVYKIDTVWNNHYQINALDLGNIDLSEIPEVTTLKDTTYTYQTIGEDTIVETNIQEYQYHYLRNFIYYNEPTIHLFGANSEPLIGEPEYYYTNPDTEVTDTIDLVNNSPFNCPVFVMGSSYDIDIRVLSVYTNYDEPVLVYDTVPVKDAQVTIINSLEITEPTHHFNTDATGSVDYNLFRVGLPNMSMNTADQTSFTKTITITAQAGSYNIAWNGGDVYRAYVLGGVDAGGVNYVTYGPEVPQFILRDPPGDRSYTMLEQGSSFSASRDYSFNMGGGSEYDNVLNRGVRFEAGGGLAGPVFESEVTSDVNAGISTEQSVDRSGKFMEKYTFTQTYSTSSDPTAVGSMADVYIGKSMNLFFTETENLRIYPKSYCENSGLDYLDDNELSGPLVEYSIGKRPGFAVTDDPSSTLFIYSQDHILNSLLPTYRELIYSLLAISPNYNSKIPADHLYYGFSNDNPVWADTIEISGDILPSYEFLGEQSEVDSIGFLNQQISLWIQTIALNEASKLSDGMDEVENISFDGNAGAYTNSVEMTTESFSHTEYFYKFELFGGSSNGFSINETGLCTSSHSCKNASQTIGSTDIETEYLKWTYVIDDSNQGDYYSVNVMTYNNGTLDEGRSSFLNSNNFDEPGYNMGNLGLASGIGAIGSMLVGKALTKLVNPLAGQVAGMANTVATTAAYMGVMRHYSKDVSNGNVYYGLQGASPMFKIMGGQSSCPYEGEEYTIFFIDSVTHEPFLLHPGTQNHEAPKIEVEPATVINVPDGSAAVFEIKLMNESPTGEGVTYELLVDEASNPDGAVLKIDGISPNRQFFVPAGQTLTKTLTVERGASGIMEFDDLQLIFHSSCQYDPDDNFPDIADTVAFSAHFVPTCSEVDFINVSDNWVVNVYNNDIMPITVGGYDYNLSTFQKVYFQYQQAGSTPTTGIVLYNDIINTDWAEYTGEKLYIDGQSEVSFNWNTSALNDGNYTLLLTSTCSDGSIFETEPVPGIIDRITPRPFGAPQPSDGVLSYGEDISALFNEPINTGEMYNFGQYGSESYISVRGMLNGTDLINSPNLLHDASVHFDGEDDIMTIDHVNLDHSDFTIEFWAKRNANGRECIINMGDPALGGLWIGYNEVDNFVIEIDGQTMISENTYSNLDDWVCYSLAYNRGDESFDPQLLMLVLSGSTTDSHVQEIDVFSSLEGTMNIGFCPEDASAFNGNIHELRIWNYCRLSTEISSQKGQILNGYEEGLYSLWPMTDATGSIAKDISFGRDAVVDATWHVSRDGKAVEFDGTNCFPVTAGSMAFSNQSDFTIEFWYKTDAPFADVNLISNGNPDEETNINSWNIIATSDQEIIINNNGVDITINALEYLDNNWHHFAMSLNRIGYLNIYIDANLVKTSTVTQFEGFGAGKLVAGARWYNLSMVDYYDQYLTGVMDEIRVWNCSRTQDQIQRYMNHTLTGDEMGLKAYFPFEDVTIEDPSISNENSGNFTMDTIGIAGDSLLPASVFTSETPNMKLQRPEILIPHNIVLSNDGLIITTNVNDASIENQIIDISVKRIKDLNGNEMPSTLSWSAFVDRNNVVWDMQELDIEKFVEEETSLTVNIRNNGGINENYTITNIPSWMEVSPSSGTLLPLETEEIEIIINSGLNIGLYQRDLNLVGSMDYNERLAINVKVNAHAPNWSVEPEDYQYTANIIGQLSIADILSTDVDDMVACFVDDECRSVANVQYFEDANIYLCFMSVYSNEENETIEFKVFDASTGEIFTNVSPDLVFESNLLYGSVSEPLPINATNYVEQTIELSEGWNWVSFNVYADEFNNLNQAFEELIVLPNDLIKSQEAFADVNDNLSWMGSLSSLDVESTYKMRVGTSQVMTMEGYRVVADTVEIPIVQGWNWIGYPLSVQKNVIEALSSLEPSENDLIKSQYQFAVYSNILGWVGSLTYMQPGEGYIMYSSTDGSLEYSSGIIAKNSVEFEDDSYLPNTKQNMTIVAALEIKNPELYGVVAYDKNGLCGIARPIKLNDGRVRFCITINSTAPETIRFEARTLYGSLAANELIGFEANKMFGNLDAPMLLTFGSIEISNMADVYPNPFSDRISLDFYLNKDQKIQMKLYNSLGTEICAVDIELGKGSQKLDLFEALHIDKKISNGVYLLKLMYNDKEELIKIVKQ